MHYAIKLYYDKETENNSTLKYPKVKINGN